MEAICMRYPAQDLSASSAAVHSGEAALEGVRARAPHLLEAPVEAMCTLPKWSAPRGENLRALIAQVCLALHASQQRNHMHVTLEEPEVTVHVNAAVASNLNCLYTSISCKASIALVHCHC